MLGLKVKLSFPSIHVVGTKMALVYRVDSHSRNIVLFYQYVNRAFLELSGYSIEEVIGQPAWDILQPYDSKIVRRIDNTRLLCDPFSSV